MRFDPHLSTEKLTLHLLEVTSSWTDANEFAILTEIIMKMLFYD